MTPKAGAVYKTPDGRLLHVVRELIENESCLVVDLDNGEPYKATYQQLLDDCTLFVPTCLKEAT